MGVQLPIEECFEGDLSFELNSGGKVVFHADEETGNGKWAVADNKLTITIQGEEMVADVGENTFTFFQNCAIVDCAVLTGMREQNGTI